MTGFSHKSDVAIIVNRKIVVAIMYIKRSGINVEKSCNVINPTGQHDIHSIRIKCSEREIAAFPRDVEIAGQVPR